MLKRSTRRRANRGSCGSFQGLAISRPYATRTPSSVCLAIWRSTAMLTGSERMTSDGFGGVGDLVAEHTAIEVQSRMVDAPLHPTGTQPVLSSGLTSCPRFLPTASLTARQSLLAAVQSFPVGPYLRSHYRTARPRCITQLRLDGANARAAFASADRPVQIDIGAHRCSTEVVLYR